MRGSHSTEHNQAFGFGSQGPGHRRRGPHRGGPHGRGGGSDEQREGRGASRGGHRGGRFGSHEDGPSRFRGRTRRGEIRTALLAILAEAPGHGYDLIQRIEEKTGGTWKPSPGSVYPTLQLLEDEGLVVAPDQEGKRTFQLTETGLAENERRQSEVGEQLWSRGSEGRERETGLLEAIKGIALAATQVSRAGNPSQIEAATEILRSARKKLYAILAED